jgi:hypothetical protein|tara:strand:+ start:188 stop:337 length:150 start_codon:yes stop_codon:yes gene_type:complete
MKKTIFNQKTQTWTLTQMTNKEIAEWEAQKATRLQELRNKLGIKAARFA